MHTSNKTESQSLPVTSIAAGHAWSLALIRLIHIGPWSDKPDSKNVGVPQVGAAGMLAGQRPLGFPVTDEEDLRCHGE